MADLLLNALRTNLARAEAVGNTARAERIRARLEALRPTAAPAPAPVVEPEAEGDEWGEWDDEPEPEPDLTFASERAAEVAAELGVGAEAFDFMPSGQGGYTVADVRRAAEGNTTTEEE